jgi:hypothetical protein
MKIMLIFIILLYLLHFPGTSLCVYNTFKTIKKIHSLVRKKFLQLADVAALTNQSVGLNV